jgi:hypothetical protein
MKYMGADSCGTRNAKSPMILQNQRQRTRGRAENVIGICGPQKSTNDFLYRRNQFIIALEIYMAEADKLCQMLSACNGDAVNVADQVALTAQRYRENDAHDEYIRARKRLLRSSRSPRPPKLPSAFVECRNV